MLQQPLAELFRNKQRVLLLAQAWIHDPQNPNFLLKNSKAMRRLLMALIRQLLSFDSRRYHEAMKRALARQAANPYVLLLEDPD